MQETSNMRRVSVPMTVIQARHGRIMLCGTSAENVGQRHLQSNRDAQPTLVTSRASRGSGALLHAMETALMIKARYCILAHEAIIIK